MTPIATLILEDDGPDGQGESCLAYRERIGKELAGIEKLEGTYPFTLERSVRGSGSMNSCTGSSSPSIASSSSPIRSRCSRRPGSPKKNATWSGGATGARMIHYGVIFFMLEKLGAVIGTHEPAHLRSNARPIARGLPEDAQRAGALLGRRQGRREERLGQSGPETQLVTGVAVVLLAAQRLLVLVLAQDILLELHVGARVAAEELRDTFR